MSTLTGHRYVTRKGGSPNGEPVIEGTRITVRDIVELWRLGMPPEEMTEAYPHLSLAQVFDALSFFADHKDEINEWIERNRVPAERLDSRIHRQ